MKTAVLWRTGLADSHGDAARALLSDGAELIVEPDPVRAAAFASRARILVDPEPDEALLDGPALRHVIIPSAGVRPDLLERMRARPHLRLYNSHHHAPAVAEHAVALLLACAHRLLEADRHLRRGSWLPRHDPSYTYVPLMSKTCLILGFGAIGRRVAGLVAGFGMRVTALRRRSAAVEVPLAAAYGPTDLHTALADADAVIVTLPLTAETRSLLDAPAFAAMRVGVVVVNVGRGEVIDQHALYRALRAGIVAAAGLDVWWNYPCSAEQRARTMPSDAPLYKLPNVVMSPHRAGGSDEAGLARSLDLAETIRSILAGGARNRVEPWRGY